MAMMEQFRDGLKNLAVGMGLASRDKFAGASYAASTLSTQEIANAYETSWITAKAIDIPADDATRNWRAWQADGAEIEAIEKEERRLNLRSKVNQALKYARLWGGAAIVFSDGTDAAEPVNPDRVGRGGLKYAQVLTCFDLTEGDIEQDPESPYFGKPSFYRMNMGRNVQVNVHPSRLVLFEGDQRARLSVLNRSGSWGLSVLERIHNAAKAADSTHHNIAALIFEAKIDVIGVPDLARHFETSEGEQRLISRFGTASLIKGINGTLILDAEETYNSKSASFQNLRDIMAMMLQIVSGAADIPATRFMAQSPAGLNATGDNDTRNYYDMVSSIQENLVGPAMSILDECLIRSALGSRPDNVHYTWASLWQTTDKEKAEIAKLNAESADIIMRNNLLPGEVMSQAVLNQMIEGGNWPGIEAAHDEWRAANGDDFDLGQEEDGEGDGTVEAV